MAKFKYINIKKEFNKNLANNMAYGNAVGIDVESTIEVVLEPLERAAIPLGLIFCIPEDYEIQVRPRSGVTVKKGLYVALGTIDPDYRGEINAIVFNLSNETVKINPGDRIAQLVFNKKFYNKNEDEIIECESFDEFGNLKETERNDKGFGSSDL